MAHRQFPCRDSPVAAHLVVDVPVVLQLPFVAHSTVAVLGHGGYMPVVEQQLLGGAAGAVLAVMDVAVFTQRQVGVSRTVEVPQIQSSRRLRTFPLRNRDGYAQCSCAWRALFGRHGGGDEG